MSAGRRMETVGVAHPGLPTALVDSRRDACEADAEPLALVGGAARLGVALGPSEPLDLERFSIAWSEARSLCSVQANLLELAASALDDAGVELARHTDDRIAIVGSHAPTLDGSVLSPTQARVRSQSTSTLLARGLGLTARTLDVAPSTRGLSAVLDAAHMLLRTRGCDAVLAAISASELVADAPQASVACLVLRRVSSARRAHQRIRGVLTAEDQAPQAVRELAEALGASEPSSSPLPSAPAAPSRGRCAHPLLAACTACASRADRHALVADDLLDRLRVVVSQAQETQLARDTAMDEIGLDSLAVVELKQRFERELTVRVSLKALLGCRRIDDVAGVLLDALESGHGLRAPDPAPIAAALSGAGARDLLQRLDQLSEHELDLVLQNAKGDLK